MRSTHLLSLVIATLASSAAFAQITEPIDITGDHTRLVIGPEYGATIETFELNATGINMVGGNGLLQEGFGVPNYYVPGRRVNENVSLPSQVTGQPQARYEYDCEGPNLDGLHGIRVVQANPDESAVRVIWRIENRGNESHWLAPWVQNDFVPGGAIDPEDSLRVPAADGLQDVLAPGIHVPARNWIAATDGATKQSVYGVFNADHTYSYASLFDSQGRFYGVRTVFAPRLMRPGDAFETSYFMNIVRGLDRIDFASEVCALQIDYRAPQLEVLFAPVRAVAGLQLEATVVGADGEPVSLPPKSFDLTPGRLIRCTYDWEPPGEGTYEFLGKLSQGGRPFNLNERLGTPHGGIDTQFTVGDVQPARFEPWTDAPYKLERKPRVLQRALASEQPVPIWIESPFEKIAPGDTVSATGVRNQTVRVSMARNEYESFQIVVRPKAGQRLGNVVVRAGELQHTSGSARLPGSNVSLHRVEYVPLRVPSHFEGPSGAWPDPLPPLEPFSAEGGRCSPIWGTVYVPDNMPPGVYRGPLYVTSDATDQLELQLEVTVFDFTLPNRPALRTDFGYTAEHAYAASRARGYAGTQDDLDARFLADALDHRVTLRELTQLPAESPNYPAALSAYKERLPQLLDGGVSTIPVPASLQEFPEQLALANEFVAENDLQQLAFTPLAHEPPRPAWPRLNEYLIAWRRGAPAIRPMVTTFGIDPYLEDPLRIWGVHVPVFDSTALRPILEHITTGGEVWWYVDEWPPRPYGNFFIDFAAIEHRTLFWQTWALGIRGMHYWNINYAAPDADPYQGLTDNTPVNGNGYLVYPGKDGPVSSIRWETIRDGIEDYDYLALVNQRLAELEKRGGNAALQQRAKDVLGLGPLVQDLVGFPREPELLLRKRQEIAELIVALGAAR